MQESIAPRGETTDTVARHCKDRATALSDDAPRLLPSSTTLLPHVLFAPRRTFPFGLDNAATSLARTIRPNVQTYVERPMVLPRDARAQQSPHLGSGWRKKDADVSTLQSRIPTLSPTATTLRGNASISTEMWRPQMKHKMPSPVAEPLWQERIPRRLGTTVKSTPHLRRTKPHNLRSYGSSKRSLTKIASASPSLNGPSNRTNRTHMVEAHADELEKCTNRSSKTGSQNSP